MIVVGYVKVAPWKPQTGRIKLKVSPGIEEAKFSLGKGKYQLGRVLQRSIFLAFPPLRKAYLHTQKNYDNFSRVIVIANQLLTSSSLYLAPWMNGKPFSFCNMNKVDFSLECRPSSNVELHMIMSRTRIEFGPSKFGKSTPAIRRRS